MVGLLLFLFYQLICNRTFFNITICMQTQELTSEPKKYPKVCFIQKK